GLDELAAEYGVLPLHGVLVFKRIADAQITHENRSGDLAAVHSLLKPGLALQEAHRRRVRAVEGFGSAQKANGVQLQAVVLRNKHYRDMTRLREGRRIVDLHAAVNVNDRFLAQHVLRVDQRQDQRLGL